MIRLHQKFYFLLLTILISAVNAFPQTGKQVNNEKEILTPKPKPQPRINGPLVYGSRPGHPFLYRIPCQGERPIQFLVKNLPAGLKLDPSTGIITGVTPLKGDYDLLIFAANSKGKSTRKLKIIAGDKLALTPPMGWSPWYVHFNRITDKLIREAADNMISSGMADVGYQYINVDDCWMNATETNPYMQDSTRVGPIRKNNGDIIPNIHFPDMLAMTQYIHSLGLKAGIYSTPGPTTCTVMTGSWNHEEQDAAQYAAWGFDFLKYDWCSYNKVVGQKPSLEQMKKPFELMGNALSHQSRDIVYNLCQYGMGNVWEWGTEVSGNSWRTGSDLGFELNSFFSVALKNAEHGEWSKPGAWNDPDYLQIGSFGSQIGTTFTLPKPSLLSGNQQYSYMSLWTLMAAPLFFSGDMTKLDEFTLNVLCNPEVIDVNLDPLGKCGSVIKKSDSCFLMVKKLVDGSTAVGLFNQGGQAAEVSVDWSELKISGKYAVRDIWRQKRLGMFKEKFTVPVPAQGVVMVKISKP
ncbi:putative Ig domain-containing protein [Arcticibacter svalbardensis]|nr:putative Ig domain-containing protein [Arcticibacter svalbardensis]